MPTAIMCGFLTTVGIGGQERQRLMRGKFSDRQTHRLWDLGLTLPTRSRLARDEEAPGCLPGAGDYLISISYCYFFSSSIAALALSAASDDFPALHAASASLTSVEAFWKSAERGDWISWLRGD